MSNNTTGNCVTQGAEAAFDQSSWIIAISLAILAAISNNLGVNFQKLAWTRKQNNEKPKKYRLIWLFGMLGIILASVFDFVALAFGPQSVIAPLGSLTMVINGCIAPVMHGEKVRKKIVWTTFIIVSGCAMAVATASHDNIICNFAGIFGYFDSLTFLGYALVILFLTLSMGFFIRKAETIIKIYGDESEEYEKIFKYHRVSYAFLAGLFGAQSVVFARAIGQLVISSTRGEPFFLTQWQTYLILFGLICMIVIQMIYLNKGLERFESSYNVPVFTGTFIVAVAVSGGVVYGEFSQFSQIQVVLFPLGVCLCVLGVFALAWGNDEDTVEIDNEALPTPPTSLPPIPPTPSRKSSLRLHSGGFTPFVIGISDDPIIQQKHIRQSIRQSIPHHGRDLLTGLKTEDLAAIGFIAPISPRSQELQLQSHQQNHHQRGGSLDDLRNNKKSSIGMFFHTNGDQHSPRVSDSGVIVVDSPKISVIGFKRAPSPINNSSNNNGSDSPSSVQTPKRTGSASTIDELAKPLSPNENTPLPPNGYF